MCLITPDNTIPETDSSADKDITDTDSKEPDVIYTYYEKVYADPADSIFWYGFGQGIMQFFTVGNTSLAMHMSDEFCYTWDYITGQYELTYYVNNVNTNNTQVLMEYDENGTLKNSYTYGNERISIDSEEEKDYYLYDGRGSVSQVVNANEIVEAYTYDPFGNVAGGAPDFESFYGYNAEETNPVTGLQYLRARYYDSTTGRFCVADSYLGDVTNPLTLNRYIYTLNNPVMYNDPSGHIPKWLKKVVNSVKETAEEVTEWTEETADKVYSWGKKTSEKIYNTATKTASSAKKWANSNIIQPMGNAFNDAVKLLEKSDNIVANKLGAQLGAAATTLNNVKTTVEKTVMQAKQMVNDIICEGKRLYIDTKESIKDELGIYDSEDEVPRNTIAAYTTPDITGVTFKEVLYLNRSDGAFMQGHAAIILVTSENEGYYYSVTGDMLKGLGTVLGGNIQGGISTVVDSNNNVVPLTSTEIDNFRYDGKIYNVIHLDKKKTDKYDRYISIPITHEEGVAMFEKAEEYRTNEDYTYSLYGENCGMVAQYILAAGGKSFVMSDWSAEDEKQLFEGIKERNFLEMNMLGIDVVKAYKNAFDDCTIPNAAYKMGAELAYKIPGWDAQEVENFEDKTISDKIKRLSNPLR